MNIAAENLYLKENSFTVICLDVCPRLGDQYSDVLDVSKILHGWIESGATVGYPGLSERNGTLEYKIDPRSVSIGYRPWICRRQA